MTSSWENVTDESSAQGVFVLVKRAA